VWSHIGVVFSCGCVHPVYLTRLYLVSGAGKKMLRHKADWQALLYLSLQTLLFVWQWLYGTHWVLYGTTLFLTLGVGCVHHNHAHLTMWTNRSLNRLTDMWLTLLQGHPTFVFHVTHNSNHHRHRHGPADITRTWRFGDTNHVVGYLLHPLQAFWVVFPCVIRWLRRLFHRSRRVFSYCLMQYAAVLVFWAVLAAVDWQKWILIVLIPQLFGLHWLLASNYLQHAHADGHSRINFARNFEGLINPLLFNVGLHTAHHLHGRAHWSELPELHRRYRPRIHARLRGESFTWYILKTWFLSLPMPQFRSRSLMRDAAQIDTVAETVEVHG